MGIQTPKFYLRRPCQCDKTVQPKGKRAMTNNMKKKAVRKTIMAGYLLITTLLLTLAFANLPAMAADLAGNVQGAGSPIAERPLPFMRQAKALPRSWPKAKPTPMAR